MQREIIAFGIAVALGIGLVFAAWMWSKAQARATELAARYKPVIDIEAERRRVADQLSADRANLERARRDLEGQQRSVALELQGLQERRDVLSAEIREMDETATMQSFGVYKRVYDFPTSAGFAQEIERIEADQQAMVKAGQAAVCSGEWIVEGSKKKGEQMTKRNLTMMLRAFNGECDAAIARVKYNNVKVMYTRIEKAAEAINKLGAVNKCAITRLYVNLRLAELHAVHEQREKLQAEKDEQRAIREQMREEEIAEREMDRVRIESERDEAKYQAALTKARAEVEAAEGAKRDKLLGRIEEMERLLAEAQSNKERAIARAQMTRSGHVYVISNIGSFGEHVYKIGMTRRLDPMERVHELGDASVPFEFDVHAIIYSEDAPRLESDLHRVFGERRVNLVNLRKEFFYVDIEEIEREVRARHADIMITKVARAEQFRKTSALLTERGQRPGWGAYDRRTSVAPASTPVVA